MENTKAKYLDKTGLSTVWAKTKELVNSSSSTLSERITILETFKDKELSSDKFIKLFGSDSFVAAVTSDGYCIENPEDVSKFEGVTVVAILVATPEKKLLIPAANSLGTAYFCNGAQTNTSIIAHPESYETAVNFTEGFADTKVLRDTLTETSWAVNKAYNTTLFGKNCYLPSLGELKIILDNKEKIEAHTANTVMKFTSVTTIWSSTLATRVDNESEDSYLLTVHTVSWRLGAFDTCNVQNLSTVLPVLALDTAEAVLYTTGKGDRFLNNAGRYVSINMEDLLSYGVSWKTDVADPQLTRVGNMTYHKTLPIQSKMRGCIAQPKNGGVIKYYLDSSDWRWMAPEEAQYHILQSQTLVLTDGVYTLVNDVFSTLQYEHQYVKINNVACKVTAIDTASKTATLVPESSLLDGTYDVQLGAVLNGYDGEVKVEVPEFWIKSWDADDKEVRISPTYIDSSWEHQPRILISAFIDTVLQSVPENMGYLSTLPANSGISVCNINTYCRGGNNNTNYDVYLPTDPARSLLGKGRTQLPRSSMRIFARNSGNEILSYLQYKRAIYWLYVIEYANFNSQATYNSTLTSEGFRQGGLGAGVTIFNAWSQFNGMNPITPNGYSNTIGNGTGVKNLKCLAFSYDVQNYNVNQYTVNTQVIKASNGENNSKVITEINSTDNYGLSGGNSAIFGDVEYVISGIEAGQKIIFKLGNAYSTASTLLEVTEDGTYIVPWGDYGKGELRTIGFGSIQESCSITIYRSNNPVITKEVAEQTVSVCRWRGIENPFGDVWKNTDGIICVNAGTKKGNVSYVDIYATEDPSLYSDSDYSKMKKVGEQIGSSMWIKEFDLGNTAEIIPITTGGNATSYKCDYHWFSSSLGVFALILGGDARDGGLAGLGLFSSYYGVGSAYATFGFRSSCVPV